MGHEHKNALEGHSVLLVESMQLLVEMYGVALADYSMIPHYSEMIPSDLDLYLRDNNLDSAIIHTGLLTESEEESLIQSHKNGKKIVVIKRDPPAIWEEADMYQRIENVGIPTVLKNASSDVIGNAFLRLLNLFTSSE